MLFKYILGENGITVWIDGGWSVDALLGKQTRDHDVCALAAKYKTHI